MPDTENISWTASFVERFSLSKVCIFKAETLLGSMMGVNLPFEFCWQKNCSQLLKSRLFHSQPYLGKFSGCWFFLHYNSWCQPMNFLAKTWSLDFLSKSSSSRMPHNFLYGFATQPTENNQFTPLPLFKGCLTRVYFQCWDTARKYVGCQTGNWALLGNGTPLQYSCLENPMDRGAWSAAIHEVSKSWTQLSNFTFTFHFHALEKEMATRSSVLAWRIPGAAEPGGLLSMGSHRVGHDWSDLAATAGSLLSFCESRYVSFWNPPRETLWLFEKTLWVLLLSSLPSVLVTWPWLFWRNAVLASPY